MDISIIDWILKHNLKNEKGDPIEFKDHLFLWDIYKDQSQYICVMKCAQAGLSVLEVLKNIYDAHSNKMDIIYTLPTDGDVNVFVGGKVNRIITQNPILLEYTKDKDSVEQKQIGDSMVYFRGTFTKKAAIMVTADRLVHDEVDSSKQDVVKDYEARLQHSKFKQKHVFSHPSTEGTGVSVEWQDSDQKHWFITCRGCSVEQFLSWDIKNTNNMSIDFEKKAFVCKNCGKVLTQKERRIGQWKKKIFKDSQGNVIPKKYSGYWISLLMCPWVTAQEIIDKYNDPQVTEEFFYNKILGLPYIGAGNKLTKEFVYSNLTLETITPENSDRAIMGVDTGIKLDFVMGSTRGLFYNGEAKDYGELDTYMRRWPKMIAIVDGGGDLIGSRKFQERWKGRVYLCYLGGAKGSDKPIWNEDEYTITVDRNKCIQWVVDEFREKRIPLQGTETDWYEYALDWNNLHRIREVDSTTGQFKGYKWVRTSRDHRALATVFWRIGADKFDGATVSFNYDQSDSFGQVGLEVLPNGNVFF